MALPAAEVPPWRGFHHIALVTPNLDETIGFYGGVLGMQVSAILPASGGNGRHCFIKPGATDAWGLHVFELADAQLFAYPESMQRFAFVPGALQHIAFALPDRAAAQSLRDRLAAAGVQVSGANRIGPIENMLFRDNNGMLLEATWPAEAH